MQTTSLVLAALLLGSPLLRAAQEGKDWPGWRGPERDGIAHESSWTATGQEKELWRAEVGRGYSCVAVANGRLYTKGHDVEAELDVVRCLDALTGEELWAHAYPSKLWDTMHEGGTLTTPVVAGERVYVLSRLGKFLVLDAATGEVREVSASDGRLIVLSEEGELLIAPVTPKGFEPLAKTKLFDGGVCWTTPVLAHGILYCRSSTGTLVARDHRAVQ